MKERTKVDPSAYGLDLPDGWVLWTKPASRPEWVQWYLTASYSVRGWEVVIEADLNAPWSGPSSVSISFGQSVEGVEAAIDSDGITLEVLRAVPLGEARKVLAEWGPRVLAAVAPDKAPQRLPERVETPHDYALVAAEYVRLVNNGERRPIHVMAEACGISRNTMSARVRRARDQGLINQTSTGDKLRAELSSKATTILNETEN